MSVLRYVIVTSTGGALAAALLFACATSVDIGQQELPSEDGGTAQAIPDVDLPDEDAPADAAPADVVTSACSTDGFCFQPVPIQMALAAVSGSSMDDVWAGAGKNLLRYRGTQWELAYEYARATPPSITFSRIWATTPDNVWAFASRRQDDPVRTAEQRFHDRQGARPPRLRAPARAVLPRTARRRQSRRNRLRPANAGRHWFAIPGSGIVRQGRARVLRLAPERLRNHQQSVFPQ